MRMTLSLVLLSSLTNGVALGGSKTPPYFITCDIMNGQQVVQRGYIIKRRDYNSLSKSDSLVYGPEDLLTCESDVNMLNGSAATVVTTYGNCECQFTN